MRSRNSAIARCWQGAVIASTSPASLHSRSVTTPSESGGSGGETAIPIRYAAVSGAGPSGNSAGEAEGEPMAIVEDVREKVDLSEHGLTPRGRVFTNPTTALLYAHTILKDDGTLAEGGPLVVDTGHHTGRPPTAELGVRGRG